MRMDADSQLIFGRRLAPFSEVFRALRSALTRARKQRVTLASGVEEEGKAEVIAILPCAGVTEEELLSVAASAQQLAFEPVGRAIVRRASVDGVALIEAEDFHEFAEGGIHCWVGHVPTLVGPHGLLVRLGINVDDADGGGGEEVYVAQGSRWLGRIRTSFRGGDV